MINVSRIGVTIFAIAVALGPIYTVNNYSIISNLISELGAQHTKNNFIMIIAFAILGGSIAFDGIRKFQISLLPFILFGLAMAIVGFFPHKPLDASLAYNNTIHSIHGIIASMAGTVITVGFLWQGFRTTKKKREYFVFIWHRFPLFFRYLCYLIHTIRE
jgi:hypothetical membrane protein